MRPTDQLPEPQSGPPWDIVVGSGGRVVIPAAARASLGISPGSRVRVRIADDGLLLTTPQATTAWLRRLASELVPPGHSVVDELIAERRAEAAREASDG